MVLATTHLAAGLASAYLIDLVYPGEAGKSLLLFGALAGELPDLDFIYFGLFNKFTLGKQSYKHRADLLHTPLPHIVVAAGLYVFLGWVWALTYLLATLSHLVLDSIDCSWGIKWAWPITDIRYRIFVTRYKLRSFKPEKVLELVKLEKSNECLSSFWSIKNWQFWFEMGASGWFFWQLGLLV